MRPIFRYLDQTSLTNKGFIIWIYCQEIPSGQDSSILTEWVANPLEEKFHRILMGS